MRENMANFILLSDLNIINFQNPFICSSSPYPPPIHSYKYSSRLLYIEGETFLDMVHYSVQ